MKTRFLIILGIVIIGVIITLTVGTMEYQSVYNQNCNSDGGKIIGFLKCIYIHEDFALPNPFKVVIPFDQTFQYEDLELFFYDVEDSRCPLDVTCIWEGEVTAMIHVRNQTHKTAGYFTPGYTISYITPYNVTLVDVQPHPVSTEKPDYIATLEITKLDDGTSSYMNKIVPTLDDFRNTLNESQDINTIFFKFGEPHNDIGSGIHIYVYELNDSTQIWIGYVDKILYVQHVDVKGNILEKLFQDILIKIK